MLTFSTSDFSHQIHTSALSLSEVTAHFWISKKAQIQLKEFINDVFSAQETDLCSPIIKQYGSTTCHLPFRESENNHHTVLDSFLQN